MKDKSFYSRYGLAILAVALFLLPIVALGAHLALRNNANDVRDWLPGDYPETLTYGWFQKHFGSEEFLVVSWDGCTLDDPRLPEVADRLKRLTLEEDSNQPLFKRVITGRSVVDELMSALDFTRSRAASRLEGSLVGREGEQTCIITTLTAEAKQRLHDTLRMVRETSSVAAGLPPSSIRLGGPPAVSAAIDETSTQSLTQLAMLAGAIGVVIAWWCFRSLIITLFLLIVGGYGAAASLAVVGVTGLPMNAILMTMAPLVYVAAVSGGIHLSNYYLDAAQESGATGAAGRAVAHAWVPLGLATSTTSIGLLSLAYSDLMPIQRFGIFSAIGVVISFLLLIFVLPSAFEFLPPRRRAAPKAEGEHHETGEAPLPPVLKRFGEAVIRRHAWVAAAGFLVLGTCALGLRRVETSIEIMRFFPEDAEIIQTYRWFEDKLGPLVPMEVIIRLDEKKLDLDDKEPKLSVLDRIELVELAQQRIESLPHVGGTLSATTFCPKPPRGLLGRTALESKLKLDWPDLKKRVKASGYLAEGDGEELWRINVRISALEYVDYGEFVKQLQAQVDPVLEGQVEPFAERMKGLEGVSATYTGMVPIVWKARRSLLDGLIFGFGTDLILIVVAVVVLMRHWSPGIILFLTSVVPTVLAFGLMGWFNIVVDIGTVMTPSVALGVTVDDVVHFLLWFRRGIEKGMDRPRAVMLAYEGCARAMYQSWGVLGLGLSVFALSSFTPTLRFGALMIALLTAGLVGNLCFLPALLAGPLGAIIARRVRKTARYAGAPHITPSADMVPAEVDAAEAVR